MPTFLASSVSNESFSGVLTCDESYPVEYYHYAAAIHAEARGEGRDGMLAVLSGLRNGARGYKVGKLDPEIVELVVEGMKKPVTHGHRHWIRFDLATDERQIGIARKAIKMGDFLKVRNHYFY